MMTEFPHLYPASRAVAAMSAEERIHRIRADRWIAYPRAQAALAKLEELISFPERARMRIPTYPPTHSDSIRPLVPGYPPTCDALR